MQDPEDSLSVLQKRKTVEVVSCQREQKRSEIVSKERESITVLQAGYLLHMDLAVLVHELKWFHTNAKGCYFRISLPLHLLRQRTPYRTHNEPA
jgi:hypothetical protein